MSSSYRSGGRARQATVSKGHLLKPPQVRSCYCSFVITVLLLLQINNLVTQLEDIHCGNNEKSRLSYHVCEISRRELQVLSGSCQNKRTSTAIQRPLRKHHSSNQSSCEALWKDVEPATFFPMGITKHLAPDDKPETTILQ
ncbi:hypothetical protein KIN20_017329 [Parelaphostrongylus tenuis]|uniref:Uncharacterized protein n=1 Tax=Parelaphostrongylus tenuis TaxID=148309 RepID=A0AAD5N0P5_PARTN|nr:hypothetical protein KIN20_017329 [Parelaphostrongylus tenuis]